jgi:DNA polymerase-3 subunit delta'
VTVQDDQNDDIPLACANASLFGHSEAERALLEAYRGGRMPHAWLIGGPPGIGKATLAFRMARFVLAHPDPADRAVQQARSLAVSPEHPAARKIANLSHSGLLLLRREINEETGKLYKDIRVEDVRRALGFFGRTAGESGWRVAIIDSVDELNAAGENTILKILEEPPANSLLLLVSHAPGRVLPTIRSRCRRLILRPLADDDIALAVASVADRKPDDEDVVAASQLAEGSVARAVTLLDEEAREMRRRIGALLQRLPALDARALHALGDALGGADPRAFEAFMDSVNAWLSAQLRAQPQDPRRLARLADAWERANRAAAEAEAFNLDRKPLIFSMFGQLAQAANG